LTARGVQLTERDQVLLETLASLRVLTTRQVQQLLFPSEQVALRRLRRLQKVGLLCLSRSAASAHRLVTPTTQGLAVCGREARKGGQFRSPLFLQHQLGVNAFRIVLAHACARRPDLELLGFVADVDAAAPQIGVQPRRILAGSLGRSDSHVPDGAFALRRAGRSALFFFEFDRGTEVLGNPKRGLGRIIVSYLHAFAADSYQHLGARFGVDEPFRGFRALIVTSSPARLANLRNRWGNTTHASAGARFVWLAPMDILESKDILRESWVPLDNTDRRTYSVLGGEV